MKQVTRLMIIGLCSLLALNASAQDDDEFRTIFSGQPLRVSGFGGPFMNFTTIDGEFAHMMGGGGGVIVNDFFIGGYGLGLTTTHNPPGGYNYPASYELEFGHGGFWLGYTFLGKKAIHPVIHVQTGWGGISLNDHYEPMQEDAVFVVKPTIELEANFTPFFRMAVGGSYRLVQGVDMRGYSDEDLSGPGVFLAFKFGWFSN